MFVSETRHVGLAEHGNSGHSGSQGLLNLAFWLKELLHAPFTIGFEPVPLFPQKIAEIHQPESKASISCYVIIK